jgi:hypothetical protein
VEQHLWVVAARLDAEVTAAARRIEEIAGERRNVDERGGTAIGETDAVTSEQ